MMKINLASFEDFGEFSFVLTNKDTSFEGIKFRDGFRADVSLTRDGESSVIVNGTMSGAIFMTCARCLEEYEHNVDTDFLVIYKKRLELTKEDEDNDVYGYDKNIIDLYEYVKENLILEQPLKPVCRRDCKGLCPVCGKNLNKENCNCEKNPKISVMNNMKIDIKTTKKQL
ncbi:MAG: DUF177 domain-containing protein [Spirochaetia bacterium]|nr:DUF177 domain-containing protein [Spirochaetia bacterium]